MKKRLSPRLALLIIASMFMLPLAVAWLMYSGVIDYNPVETRNLGELVQPAVPVTLENLEWNGADKTPGEALGGHWVILYALPSECDDACLDEAASLRQVHRAAGRNQLRLRLLLLGDTPAETDEQLAMVSEKFHRATDESGTLTAALDQVAADHAAPADGSVYLIDPLGNIMLFYAAGFDPNDLKKDLKRLLTWSKLDQN